MTEEPPGAAKASIISPASAAACKAGDMQPTGVLAEIDKQPYESILVTCLWLGRNQLGTTQAGCRNISKYSVLGGDGLEASKMYKHLRKLDVRSESTCSMEDPNIFYVHMKQLVHLACLLLLAASPDLSAALPDQGHCHIPSRLRSANTCPCDQI